MCLSVRVFVSVCGCVCVWGGVGVGVRMCECECECVMCVNMCESVDVCDSGWVWVTVCEFV